MRRYVQFLKFYLPLTYTNIIWQKLDKRAKTILDLGCGDGFLMRMLNRDKRFKATGIDAFKPFLEKAKKTRAYHKLILSDVRKMKFSRKSFDVVFCSQLLEYLSKKEGEKLISDIERVAKKQVILGLPVGRYIQHGAEGNPFQTTKSIWQVEELRNRGYQVFGQGSLMIYGQEKLIYILPGVFKPLLFVFSYLFSPVWYLFPQLAMHMICVKDLDLNVDQ